MNRPQAAPAAPMGVRAGSGRPLPSPRRAALLADVAAIRGALETDLTSPPAPADGLPALPPGLARGERGRPLSPADAATLAGLIRRHPGESTGRIARRFAAATGRAINRMAVWKRLPRRPERSRMNPLTPREVAILLQEIRIAGPCAPRSVAARWFEKRTGRKITCGAVGYYAIHRLNYPSRRSAPVDRWPAWTDEVAVDLAWGDDDVINLGPAAAPIGAQR